MWPRHCSNGRPTTTRRRRCWPSCGCRPRATTSRSTRSKRRLTAHPGARRFYVDGLGWHASSASTGDIVFIQLGPLGLALYPEKAFAEEIGVTAPRTSPGIVLAQNVRSPEAVAEVLAQAEAAGGRIVKPAQKVFWGGTSGHFTDPDGHYWEVAHNPFFPLTADGALQLPREG
jgi:uncharacterized glyoxalase superfamily protein PhnB